MLSLNVNWLEVIVGGIIFMAIGFVGYSLPVFGRAWMAAMGKTEQELGSPGPGYALTFGGALVASYVLSRVVTLAGVVSLFDGAIAGLVVGVGFVATAFAAESIFSGRSSRLYFINAGYQVVSLLVIGAVMAIL